MAGLGFKDFQVGEVLTSADVDGYLMQQTAMRFADSAARGSALGTAPGTAVALAEGMLSYLDDTNEIEVYDGAGWSRISRSYLHLETITFSSVASANFTDGIIDATFDYYEVFVELTASSTTQQVTFRLRDGGTALTAGSYQGGLAGYSSGAAANSVATTNGASVSTLWTANALPWYYSSRVTLMGNLRANGHSYSVVGLNSGASSIVGGAGGFIFGSSATDTFDSFEIVVSGTISGTMRLFGVRE